MASGNHQGGENSVSQVDGVSDMAPACWVCDGEGSEKGQWPMPAFLSVRKLCQVRALMPDTSVPPCMPLVPFKLLPWCWSSEGVSLSMRPCVGSLKGTAWDSRSLFQQLNPCWFSQLEVMGTYLPGVGLGLLVPEISLSNFSPPHVDVRPAPAVSLPLLPVWMDAIPLIPQFLDFHSTPISDSSE